MPYLTAIDPGQSSAVVTAYYDDKTPYQPYKIEQFGGGVEALKEWVELRRASLPRGITLAEKFIPRPIENGSHTLESTLPLVCEGVLIGMGVMPAYPRGNWQPAAAQYISGGDTYEERKKSHQDLMKRRGLWLTGADVGRDDANDANSATGHALYFLARTLRHGPTIELLYEGEK